MQIFVCTTTFFAIPCPAQRFPHGGVTSLSLSALRTVHSDWLQHPLCCPDRNCAWHHRLPCVVSWMAITFFQSVVLMSFCLVPLSPCPDFVSVLECFRMCKLATASLCPAQQFSRCDDLVQPYSIVGRVDVLGSAQSYPLLDSAFANP